MTTRRLGAGVLILGLTLSACATAGQRLVAFPTRGQSQDQLVKDKGECEGYAEANKSNEEVLKAVGIATLGGAASGALGGAVLGALGGAGAGQGAGIGVAIGAVTGLIAGTWGAVMEEKRHIFAIYATCMSSRGYMLGG